MGTVDLEARGAAPEGEQSNHGAESPLMARARQSPPAEQSGGRSVRKKVEAKILDSPKSDLRAWHQRLSLSTHGKLARVPPRDEYSARIEHKGQAHTFPLGSMDRDAAASRAREIHRSVQKAGWSRALRAYPREFTFAIFWALNPMVCTYTTLYTMPGAAGNGHSPAPAPQKDVASIPVAVIEPEEACRRALGEWLGRLPSHYCRGLYATVPEALRALRREPVRLVLFNRQMPDASTVEIEKVLRQSPSRGSAFEYQCYPSSDELFVSQPGTSGGYYFRRRAPEQLLEPIQSAASNGSGTNLEWRTRVVDHVQALFRSAAETEDPRHPSRLTTRERDILRCLCQGSTDKGIARSLNISTWTVHTHLKRIYEKLGAHSRTEAVVIYLQK